MKKTIRKTSVSKKTVTLKRPQSRGIRSLRECVEKSVKTRNGDELDADFVVEVDDNEWHCYTVAMGHREFTLYCNEGTATYVVDSYGDRNTCELIDWEEDESTTQSKSRRNPFRTVEDNYEVGSFEDFSPKDQAKIIDNYRDINIDYEWWDSDFEDFTEILEILGFYKIDIRFSGFAHQGDGASFTGYFEPARKSELKRRLKKALKYAPNLPDFGYEKMQFDDDELQERSLEVYRISRHYSHDGTISSDNEDLKEFARDFSRYIYKQLEAQHDYLTSDDAVKETILANEYEFNANTFKIAK